MQADDVFIFILIVACVTGIVALRVHSNRQRAAAAGPNQRVDAAGEPVREVAPRPDRQR